MDLFLSQWKFQKYIYFIQELQKKQLPAAYLVGVLTQTAEQINIIRIQITVHLTHKSHLRVQIFRQVELLC